MLAKCKLRLSQGGNFVEIVLNNQVGAAAQEGISYWGTFTITGDDPAKHIYMGNIPPERRRWLFTMATWECRLMDAGGDGVGMGGGDLDYHELAALPPAAILSRAVLTDRAIEPVSGNTAPGENNDGFAFDASLHKGPIDWTLTSVLPEGTNVWQAP
jgi:hypothetical protein